ncbi:DUF6716 putative glycosyltransferase [Yonghaparkia sp. Root332]|uniref:DUF6716 putative glycosyltransferase n=1 Tax=Yonghaparkia sp. Root332 TaxID=1736516 RepID=UPI0006F29942|nr:DUF6716 putative glycosyltransferase [Yonghaparkia sp. Root332]KQV25506.1 hypothetical protein ASC54_00395 [Yonghaparkia sp. Root332]
MRLIAIADSDSYLKWAAGTVERLAPEASSDEVALQLLANPVMPSEPQRRAALERTRWRSRDLAVLGLDDLLAQVRHHRPEAVLVGMRGPTAAVVLRELVELRDRPVLVTGLPGVGIPATRKALYYRAQADVMLVHSRRERRAFADRAEALGWSHRFALSSLPFLEGRPPAGDDIVLAAQALVPATLEERRWLVRQLDATARRHPHRRVVLKVRAATGEQQTHAERWPLADLLAELPARAPNLVVRGGSMSQTLDTAGALATVSSTAILEAVARGIPALALDDFGVDDALINTVFRDSGLLGSVDDLIEGRFRMPAPAWAADNYLHAEADADAATAVDALVRERASGGLPPRRPVRSTLGGPLRRAWDRKSALGAHDRSLSGAAALAVGVPLRAIVRASARRVDRPLARGYARR